MAGSVVVVGAGIFGASIAHQLAADGWQVTLVDQDQPGNERATSSGWSRVIRFGHGDNTRYTRLAWRARTLWRQLEQETGTPLLVEAGVVWLARGDGGWETHSEATMRALGIPVERLSVAELAAIYPSFAGDDLAFGLLEPAAGALHASRATRLLADLAVAKGARLLRGRAAPGGDPPGNAVLLDGRALGADRVVWACGPWLAGLFPGLVNLRVSRREYYYYDAPGWTMPPLPVWYDWEGPFYGIADLDGHGLKAAPDDVGPAFDPDTPTREPDYAREPDTRAYLHRRFPALAEAPLVGARVCQYELTPDNHFVVAPLPGADAAWIVGGGSGHGFKHGPALAEYVARLLVGAEPPDPKLGLGPRAVGPGLRSATADFAHPGAPPAP